MSLEILFTFSSTNHSIYAEEILLEAGLKVKVMPLPSMIKAGCGICIRVDEIDYINAVEILNRKQIPISGVYSKISVDGVSTYNLIEVKI